MEYKLDLINEHIKIDKDNTLIINVLFNKFKELFDNIELKDNFIYFNNYQEYFVSFKLLKDLKAKLCYLNSFDI